ncbi:MAG: hypothetical protein PVJ27_09590 [Candidatus Brocadiaceae bacterium]|jgi:hypothetical protein
MAEYDHKQICPLAVCTLLIGLASGVLGVLSAWFGWGVSSSVLFLAWFAFVFGMGFAASFLYMRVSDGGDALLIESGPLALLHADCRYGTMESVQRTTARLLGRWQVRWGGPTRVYAAANGPAVRIKLKSEPGTRLPRFLVVGTDEPDRLIAFLRTRIGAGDGHEGGPARDVGRGQ